MNRPMWLDWTLFGLGMFIAPFLLGAIVSGTSGSITESDTLDTAFDRGKAINGANSLANAFRVGDGAAAATDICIYTDATLGGYVTTCGASNVRQNIQTNQTGGFYDVEGAKDFLIVDPDSIGAGSGTATMQTSEQFVASNLGIEFNESDTNPACAAGNYTIYADTSETQLKKCVNGTATNLVFIVDERHFAVATCQNTTASTNFDTPTTNAPAATCDTGSNTQKGYLAFDATTDESFEDHWILPTGFTGAINAHFRWKAAATTGATGWCMQLIRVADGSTSDPAYPAQASGNCVSDTAKGTTLQENTATISGVTCTSCAAGDHIYVRVSRDANGGAVTDDMTGDALLLTYGRTIRVAH